MSDYPGGAVLNRGRPRHHLDVAIREKLSFDDAQILRLESEAIKAHTGKLLVLDPGEDGGRLEAERLRRRVAERIAALPRLREKVVAPRLGVGRPGWADDPELDLGWHVREREVTEPLDDAALRRLAGELLGRRLDHERPLWRLDLAPLRDGRTALIGRIHHAMADGVSAIRLAAGLLWDADGESDRSSNRPGESAPGSGAASRPAPRAGPAGAGPATEARILVRLPRTLLRELSRGPDTPLDRHIGSRREVSWMVFPLERLKRIEHAAGAGFTVNDVVLAAVAGALRRWFRDRSEEVDRMRVQVPVSLHAREESAETGNRDSFLNVDLPIAEPDPLARLRHINAETRERKLDHDAETLYSFFHALGRFRPLYRGVTRITSGPREFALSVSNVPGPRHRPLILGHRVREFCSFAEPADRHALRVSVVSLGGDLAFGLCSDPDAIEGLEALARELGESLGELEREV